MIVADWVAIGVVVASLGLGALIGFGKGLKFFTSGIFGFIIGVVICALVGTVFLDVPFVADLLAKLRESWAGIEFLDKMHMDVIIYYVIMFVVVQLLRIILVLIIKAIFESENIVIKIVNRTLGAVLFLIIGVCIALLALKIVGWVEAEQPRTICIIRSAAVRSDLTSCSSISRVWTFLRVSLWTTLRLRVCCELEINCII